ncbi:hypothetical protein G6F56_006728 [Rhizopus delemar]|nr:hypothetical protein G6F56_006728 [Rhizopus delemar]
MSSPQISSPKEYEQVAKKFGYNQVLRVGNRVDISGQGGWDLLPGQLQSFTYTSLEDEIRKAFKNVELVLKSENASWKDVYSVTSYHVGFGKTFKTVTSEFPKLFKEFIGDREPLWTCVGVEALGEVEMRVEIVVTAYTK